MREVLTKVLFSAQGPRQTLSPVVGHWQDLLFNVHVRTFNFTDPGTSAASVRGISHILGIGDKFPGWLSI